MKKLSNIKIAGLSLPLYTALVIILAVVIAMGNELWYCQYVKGVASLSCWSF